MLGRLLPGVGRHGHAVSNDQVWEGTEGRAAATSPAPWCPQTLARLHTARAREMFSE